MNVAFRNSLQRIPQNTPPIWFMRQAGRYHKHYQNLRQKYSFMELCKLPELAAEVALGPIQDFDFDVAILFSDILFPLEALGMGLEYTDHGPQLSLKLDPTSINKLADVDSAIEFMQFQSLAMKATRSILPSHKSLIGFVGGLWTLFVYAVEGAHAGSLIQSKKNVHLFSQFLEKMYPLIKANIALQLSAGAEVVMIFDTAAGEVSPAFFRQWIAPSLKQLCLDFPGKIAYYSKGTQAAFFDAAFLEMPWAGQGFDHRNAITDCLSLQNKGFVQGNFDQSLLFMDPSDFESSIKTYLQPIIELTAQQRAGWVCGLGHGVLPKTPEKNVKQFIETIREVFS